MNNIRILDCTLRDGGYINEWNFKRNNIAALIHKLIEANVDIVECGFLEDLKYNEDQSLFSNVDQIKKLLPQDRKNTMLVAMTRYPELNIDNLEPYSEHSIDGIRVTFHKDEALEAIEYCKLIQKKGYKVFVQPVGTTDYSDAEILTLIKQVNEINPYAFYIVDTLGLMTKTEVIRMYYLIDNNLKENVHLGFHSHNNMQLSFSNAQELVELHSKRPLIFDASVYGMGRGAGNLNTELITEYLNRYQHASYITDHILESIDEIIEPIKQKYSWGYSAPYYMAALHECHPNYATYLMDRKTIPVLGISKILSSLAADKKSMFDKKYVEQQYLKYQENVIDDMKDLEAIQKLLSNQNILILAPGLSIKMQEQLVKKYIKENKCLVISVNFQSEMYESDIIFYSNKKRFKQVEINKQLMSEKTIVITTSNINASDSTFTLNYTNLINFEPLVSDNATLMLIKLLTLINVRKVAIAGFDGYGINENQHYVDSWLETNLDTEVLENINKQIKKVLEQYERKIELLYITETVYDFKKKLKS